MKDFIPKSRIVLILSLIFLVMFALLRSTSEKRSTASVNPENPARISLSKDLPANAAKRPAPTQNATRNSTGTATSPTTEDGDAPALVASAQPSDGNEKRPFVRRVISETWTGTKAINGQPARQRIRIVAADFKYPMLRLEEDVTLDPKTGEEIPEIRRSSVADHLLVGLRKDVDPDDVRLMLENEGYRIRSTEEGSFLLVELPRFGNPDDQAAAAKRLLELDEFIDFAEPDWIVNTAVTPNDPAFTEGKTWSFDNPGTVAGTLYDADIDGPDGWDQQNDASSVVVAVTDTGIRHTHEDLASNMWTNGGGHHGFDAYDDDTDPMDTNGHGTHVAGIIGARGNNGLGTAGVAWNVQLMALRFIGPNGGTTSDAIRVINYARLNGAHIINASWGGGGFSQGLLDAIAACGDADIAVVAAAGNFTQNNDMVPHYPSGYGLPNLVSVASSDPNDVLAFFSNYGYSHVDLAAPGADIWSCGIDSDSSYRHLSGTSMAAPHVAGALALAKAHFPGEASAALIARLNTSVDTRPSFSGKVATGGRLNLQRLLANSSPSFPNDDFDKPHLFFGCQGYWCHSNAQMTREPDEDQFSPDTGGKSIWFRWTAPSDGFVSFKGNGSIGDISVVAFEGVDRISLKRIADNFAERPAKTSYLYFYATAGRTYSFSVDSRLALPQGVVASLVHRPINDMWRDAIDLGAADRIEVTGNNCGSTAELWERSSPHAGVGSGRSVWWKWTPDFSGDFTLSTQFSQIDTVLAVYTGTGPGALVEVASNDDRNSLDWTSETSFSVNAGTTYFIAVDSYRDTSYGEIVLNGYIPGGLFILKQPAGKLARMGDQVTFEVAAAGQGLQYQWELNGQAIPGAVQPHHNILRVASQDLGDYRVRISDISDTIVSDVATLSELQTSPRIVWQTKSRSVSIGSSLDLRVKATGTAPLFYKWFKDGMEVPGADTDQLSLIDVDGSTAANYTVRVSNAIGFTTSDKIDLKVFSSPWEGWSYVDPTRQAGNVFSIIKDGNRWIAAASAPNSVRISTSVDGENWSHSFAKPEGGVSSINSFQFAYGNGFGLCAAASNGVFRNVAFKSTDLVNWQQHELPLDSGESLSGSSQMIFHDGYFYLASPFVYRSSDGINWVKQQMPSGANVVGGILVTDGASRLLVCPKGGKKVYFLGSVSGSWQEIDVDATTSSTVNSAYFNNGRFYVYLGFSRYESSDGTTWTSSGSQLPTDGFRGSRWVARQGSNVFANGDHGFFASRDGGLTWSAYQNMMPDGTYFAAADSEKVIFGTNMGGLIATDDPFTAIYPTTISTGDLVGVGYEGGQFIAQYIGSTLLSPDGERWSSYASRLIDSITPAAPYPTVAKRIGSEYWQVGYPSGILPAVPFYRGSVPGAVRLAQISGYPNGILTRVCEGPQGILSIQVSNSNSSGVLAKSSDYGETWDTMTLHPGSVSSDSMISYKGGYYFYQASFGSTYASADLIDWIDIGVTQEIAFHDGEYWVYWSGWSKHSPDLVNWSTTVGTQANGIKKLASYNGALVGILGGNVSYSQDGVNWVPLPLGFTVTDITASDSILLAAGSRGELAYTGSVSNTSPSVKITDPVEGTIYQIGNVIPVKVEAYSPDQAGSPVVRLFYDGISKGELSAPPYEFDLPVGGEGSHLIHVECQNGGGPVALASTRIVVSQPAGVNQYGGFNGKISLPGPIVRRKGLYISSANGMVSTSVDGLNWNPTARPGAAAYMQDFVEGDDRILAKSAGKTVAVTLDGVNWKIVMLPDTPYTPIRYSHGVFWSLTATNTSTGGIMTSPDGINWSLSKFTKPPGSVNVVVGDPFGTLLAINGSSGLWRSLDGGRSWTEVVGFSFVYSLAHNGERFFINEGYPWRAGSSVDGINWVWSDPDARNFNVLLVNGTAFTRDTQGYAFSLSYDGVLWQPINGKPLADTIVWADDGHFYARGTSPLLSGKLLLRSQNGIDWDVWGTWPTSETVSLIASSDGILASTTGGGLWHFSFTSKTWTQLFATRTTVPNFYDFAKDGSTIIAINAGKTLVKSVDDGRTWETIYDPGASESRNQNHTTILNLNGVWLSWSPGTRLIRSVDGQVFTDVTTSTGSNTFKAITENGTEFAAIRNDGAFMISSDGLNWSESAPPGSFPHPNPLKLVANGTGWRTLSFGTGDSAYTLFLSSSADGTTWNQATVTGSFSNSGSVLASTSRGDIAGSSPYRFSADQTTWVNTNANSSTLAYEDEFYQVKNGWLERWIDGTTWQQIRFFGSAFIEMKVADDVLYLFGDGAFSKMLGKDVAISEVATTTATYGAGETLDVSFVLTNTGSEPTPSGNFETQVFLSADGFHGNEDDQALGTANVAAPALQPGESASLQVRAIIPNMVRPGEYRAGIWYDRPGSREETNASNNFGITLLQPVGIPGFLLSTSSVGDGVIAQDTGQRLFANGSRVSLVATSGKGARFTGWGGDAFGTESEVTILMSQDRNVQANFTSLLGLQVMVRGAGQVTGTGDQGLFAIGETASLQAVPAAGWVFREWSGAAAGNSASASVLMDAPKAVTASFVLPFQAWKQDHFTTAELLDAAVAGDGMDPDADGLENWKEYLHGSNPRDPLSRGLLQAKSEGGYLSLIFTRLAGAEGSYRLACKGSRNMSDWDSPDLEERILGTVDGIETVEARMTQSGQPRGFIRFIYQQ